MKNFIVSYPKSGRTWLRAMLGTYFVKQYNLNPKYTLETHQLTKQLNLPITSFTHDGTEWSHGNPVQLLPNLEYNKMSHDKHQYSNSRVVVLQRNIKDTIVSAYFQATKRDNVFSGTLSEFIRSDCFGVKRILNFYYIWSQNMHVPLSSILITYEDMHDDPARLLKTVLSFIGESTPTQQFINESVSECSFQNLQQAERENKFDSVRLQAGSNNDPESYKVRRGKVGGYTAYLSLTDIAYIDEATKEFQHASI